MTIEMTAHELHERPTEARGLLLDVRTPGEFREARISGSVNVPMADLDRFVDEIRQGGEGRDVVLLCRTGRRAELAREKLEDVGLTRLWVLKGGIVGWTSEGYSVEKGRAGMSIERQVRITAGALVALGTALGFFVHAGWLVLPAFVGAGLVFSGVTDSCAMGLLLGRLPFNRVTRIDWGAASCSAPGRPAAS